MKIQEIIFSSDRHKMNWLRPDAEYAGVRCPEGFISEVSHRQEADLLYTEIRITNVSPKPYITDRRSIGFVMPLDTRYEKTENCLDRRAHAHVFCGENVSWIMALRMGGDPPHLGMVLTEGSLCGYSVEHNGPLAHDRGFLVLHPSADIWHPGETKVFSWTIFPHSGRKDFFRRIAALGRYIHVEADRYVLHPGEQGTLTVRPSFPAGFVRVDGHPVPEKDGVYSYTWTAETPGEHTFRIEAGSIRTWCRVLTHPAPAALAPARVDFIRLRQQARGIDPRLEGAYLAYDNEEERLVYTPENDFNGGRERVGMGILAAYYLNHRGADENGSLRNSLEAYTAYVLRELVDAETGAVFNDIGRDRSYRRAYNFPWFMRFFLELYELSGNPDYLRIAWRIAIRFYESEGGASFYPIEMPVTDLDNALKRNGMQAEREMLLAWEIRHADTLLQTGVRYPPQEVAFEQSIIGPAADVLLQVYEITGRPEYLSGAEEHLRLLDLFQGCQPDYHCNEVALRNWDGYWFGKRRVFGDTLPHYWSGITGNIFMRYARLTGKAEYAHRADRILRAVLPLVFADGRASCAYVFPMESNGIPGEFYDPCANDQDWGLYFNLRKDSL